MNLKEYRSCFYNVALGYIHSNGDMDFNIGIRTMIIQDDVGTYPVGGGIVWDSDPLEEWQEAQQKGKILASFLMDIKKKITPLKFHAKIMD